jgi:hypothetical protein
MGSPALPVFGYNLCMSVLAPLVIGYALVGCAWWLWVLVGSIRVARAVPVLARVDPPRPAAWPRLSLVVAACNEAEHVESAVTSILREDYPDLEVVLVDDRSSDGTGAIADRLATADDRLRVLHVTELPTGWLGKVHALARGAEAARGEWILFTDADVHFAPGTLRRAVAFAVQRGVDHVAAIPDIWPSAPVVDAVTAMFLRTFPVVTRCWAIEDSASPAFIGIGAFNLVRREALERSEGFEWLRLEVGDDMGLGLLLKRSGARCCLVSGAGLVGLYWYRNLGEMARGLEKAYASVGRCSLARMVAAGIVVTALEWAPFVMLASPGVPGLPPGLWLAGVVMLVAVAIVAVVQRRTPGQPRIGPILLSPVAALVSLVLTVRSGWLGWRRGGVLWRGTLYESRALRAGRRIRFP